MSKFDRLFARLSFLSWRAALPAIFALLAVVFVSLSEGYAETDSQQAKLTITDGVVVKFGKGAGLYVRERLTTGADVVFTSQADDQEGGQTGAADGTPKPGDWIGVIVSPDAAPAGLSLNGLQLRYGGGADGVPPHLNGGAALSIPGGDYEFTSLMLRDNTIGLRVVGAGSPVFNQLLLNNNSVGLQAEQEATPIINGSDISGNSVYGVLNLHPATEVNARGNWWGHDTGPQDTAGNPDGMGDRVSAGVDYGQYLMDEPVLACAAIPADGYVTRVRTIQLQMTCRRAEQYRIAEQNTFTTEPWMNMEGDTTVAEYTLSSEPGDKMLYVQFRNAAGSVNTFSLRQAITYAPVGPLVQFEQPAAGAVLSTDTLVSVSVTDAEEIREVELLVSGKRLALLNAPPYQAVWTLDAVRNGNYTLSARAVNTAGQSATASRQVVVRKESNASPPVVTLDFAGQLLTDGMIVTHSGELGITVESEAGIARIQGSVDGASIFNRSYDGSGTINERQYINFATLNDGDHVLRVLVTDDNGEQTETNISFTLNLNVPAAPIIHFPVDGASTTESSLDVSGTAEVGSRVQIYVDEQPVGDAATVNSSGGFNARITLNEGSHHITAQASNSRGIGGMSRAVSVSYNTGVTSLAFINPLENAIVATDTAIQLQVGGAGNISEIDLYVDGKLLASRSAAPWSFPWSLEGVTDGAHTLRAVAVSASGETVEARRAVTVQKAGVLLAQTPSVYKIQGLAIAPTTSFGDVPIKISGQVTSGAGSEQAADAELLLLLRTHGVDRRINLRSDANGRFDYSFVPQPHDAGTYEVRITHSGDAANANRPTDGSFIINRLSVDTSRYKFNATRGQTSTATVRVTASAGTGATGVHWRALPADQPSGSLPPGITLDMGEAVDIAAGATAPINIGLAGSVSAGATGTIILKLFANESGDTPRAELRLDYQLHEAQPRLTPDPTALQIGVQQGAAASAQVTITNKGYNPAHGVRVALQARQGHTLPAWLKLISSPEIGTLDVGASTLIQIDASPDAKVADGYHYAQLVVSADNDAGGSVPITIAVASEGKGGARFQFVDIYTGTIDGQNKPIEGLEGARVTLQHEALTSEIHHATSNAQGIAEFSDLLPGNWRWRVSAPNHQDASGRITISALTTASERVFLDYQLVSVEFGVTETTIQDVYDIVLEATYQTQVPAPVVILEPTSINLPAMQQGEEITGELTLVNYGLVRADNIRFALPSSDENFKYDFFAELPEQLPAQSRATIPYRITSLKPLTKGLQINLQADSKLKQIGADKQSGTQIMKAIRRFLQQGDTSVVSADTPADTAKSAAKAASCTSYHTQACAKYDYECATGDVRSGSTCASIGRITGTGCNSAGIVNPYIGTCPSSICGNDGWGNSGWNGSPPIDLVPTCMPSCSDCSAGTGNP